VSNRLSVCCFPKLLDIAEKKACQMKMNRFFRLHVLGQILLVLFLFPIKGYSEDAATSSKDRWWVAYGYTGNRHDQNTEQVLLMKDGTVQTSGSRYNGDSPWSSSLQLDEDEQTLVRTIIDDLDWDSLKPGSDMLDAPPEFSVFTSEFQFQIWKDGNPVCFSAIVELDDDADRFRIMLSVLFSDFAEQGKVQHCLSHNDIASLKGCSFSSIFQPEKMIEPLKAFVFSNDYLSQDDEEPLKYFVSLLTPKEFGKIVVEEFDRVDPRKADRVLQMLDEPARKRFEKYRMMTQYFRDLKPEERTQAFVSHPRTPYSVLKESVRKATTPEKLKNSIEELTSGSTPLRFSGFLASELARADQERAWMLRSACVRARLPKTWYYYLAPVLYQDFRDRIPADYVHLSPQKKSALLGMIRLMSKEEVGGSVLALLIEREKSPGVSEVISALLPDLMAVDAFPLAPKLDSPNPAIRMRTLGFFPPLFRNMGYTFSGIDFRNMTIPEKLKKIQKSDPDAAVREKARLVLEELDKIPLYRR